MSYIIKIKGNDFFGGWDANTGVMKVVHEKYLAYRMRRPVADNTLKKVIDTFGEGVILTDN